MQYHQRYGQTPCHPAGESKNPRLRVDFDRRLKLEFHGSKVTGLQSGQLHALAGFAEGGRALVADHAAGEVGKDRRQGGQPWPLRHVPTGGGCGAECTLMTQIGPTDPQISLASE